MTTIALPASVKIRHIEWTSDTPAQVNRSAYTGVRRVVSQPWFTMRKARVELAPIVGEANVRAWRAFLASLDGQINNFRLPVSEGAQHGSSNPTVASNAAVGATSITLSGSPPLTKGMMATISLPSGGSQMVILTADISGSVISFKPRLREAVASGTAIETVTPYVLVALSDSQWGWSVDPGTQYGISLDVEEALGDVDTGPVVSVGSPATFTMTQLAAPNRIYQRATTTGGGQGKGAGTIPVTINASSGGTVYRRLRSSDGTTVLQNWQLVTVVSTGSQTINVSADARLGWFYVDLSGDAGTTVLSGTTLVGMGGLTAIAGQSLAVRKINSVSDSTTFATLGLTVDANCAMNCSVRSDDGATLTAPGWAAPADGTFYNSAFALVYLKKMVAAAGVNWGLIGHARGSQQISAFIGAGSEIAQLQSILTAAGGFEISSMFIGHSDAVNGTSNATFQSSLSTYHTWLTAQNGARGSSFAKLVGTVPDINGTSATQTNWGSSVAVNVIRTAGRSWCAANGGVSVEPVDLNLIDGTHQDQNGLISHAYHDYRASRPWLGLSHDNAGPSIASVTRAAGSPNFVITMTMPNGGTALNGVGSYKNRFLVAPVGTTSAIAIASASISGNQITLTASSTPADTQGFDVYAGWPPDATTNPLAYNGATNILYDNVTDGDGITTGRPFLPSLAPAFCPGTQHGPNLTAHNTPTYATGKFGSALSAGWGEGAAADGSDVVPNTNTFTIECWVKRNGAPGSTAVFFGIGSKCWAGTDGSGTLTVNLQNVTFSGSGAICDNAWHHVAIVANGASGCKVYLDGTQLYSNATPHSGAANSTFNLGAFLNNASFIWGGLVDEFMVWNFAKYTANFTPPAAAYVGTETGCYALYHVDGNLNAAVA